MKFHIQHYLSFLIITSLVGIYGCSHPTVHTVEVKGNVTLDGNPLNSGTIKFIADDGETPSGGGTILSDGSYVAKVPPGKKKVLAFSSKVIGKVPEFEGVPDSPMVEKRVIVTPELYNAAHLTPLKANVTDTPQQTFDFKLVSNRN